MNALKTLLQSLAGLSDEAWTLAQPYFRRETLRKGDYFVADGAVCHRLAFVEQGLFRLFYRLEGEEKIMLFFSEGQFMADYYSFLTRTPSLRPIEALEPAVLYTLRYEELQALYAASPVWQQIGRLMAEQAYIYAVQRSNRLIHDDYDTRYLTLLAEQPTLLQRVPQYMVASYLNMTPETLSRVKSRVHRKPDSEFPSVHPPKSGLWD